MAKLLTNYLRTHRRRFALTQRELAVLLGGRSGSGVSRYERGRRIPTLSTILAYELIFDTCARTLFAGEYNRVYRRTVRRARVLERALLRGTAEQGRALERKLDLLRRIVAEETRTRA